MPLTYDLKTDLRYLQGNQAKEKEVIERMLRRNVSIVNISEYLGVTEDYVLKIAKELKDL